MVSTVNNMNQNVKFWHLLVLAILVFILFYVWVVVGGQHGEIEGIDANSPEGQKIPRSYSN